MHRRCSIPRWRLAQLNIRHPCSPRAADPGHPGLNAIGSEPELTFEMLPAAHAVLFVLAADTGDQHAPTCMFGSASSNALGMSADAA